MIPQLCSVFYNRSFPFLGDPWAGGDRPAGHPDL